MIIDLLNLTKAFGLMNNKIMTIDNTINSVVKFIIQS